MSDGTGNGVVISFKEIYEEVRKTSIQVQKVDDRLQNVEKKLEKREKKRGDFRTRLLVGVIVAMIPLVWGLVALLLANNGGG